LTCSGFFVKLTTKGGIWEMKDAFFRHVLTGNIISAYEYAKEMYLECWKQCKKNGEIPEDSSDFHKPILPNKKDLIEDGIFQLADNEDYERIS
jgi:hypothetical protein